MGKTYRSYLANGVGTVNGGFLRIQSLNESGKESENIFWSSCSTQMMSRFSGDMVPGIISRSKIWAQADVYTSERIFSLTDAFMGIF